MMTEQVSKKTDTNKKTETKEKNVIDGKRKIAFFLPNFFTALNMACGFGAIMFSLKAMYYNACMFLVLGAIFDSVDGRVARLVGGESAFGEQFDSMSDLISFGVAPALIYYHRFLIDQGRFGMIACFVFVLCGALRLARFNANIEKTDPNYFQGLPIPGAALGLIGMILISVKTELVDNYPYINLIYILIFAFFMISKIPFPSFKKSEYVKKHKKQVLFFIIIIFMTILLDEEIMVFFWTSFYVFSSMFYYLFNRKKFQEEETVQNEYKFQQ
jgi:CDP-diacylglycerol---serine O-phosphatidyltransferase